ncbi:MAG: 3-oxoadipate enol-lactonase [Roseovarius sp.]
MTLFAPAGNLTLHYTDTGHRDGPPLVLAHGLGTDLSVWDAVLPHLPSGLRVIRYDLRGHGRTDVPVPPYSMGALIRDTEGLLDLLGVRDCAFVGLGLGGMIAQGLAVKRLDLVRALVLAGTAAKWGLPRTWQAQAITAKTEGMHAVADQVMARWFSPKAIREGHARNAYSRLTKMHPDGYAGGCAAIAGTDFLTPTSGLRLPVLGIAGADDRATPPDLVRETLAAIPGSRFELMRRAGHLMCVDQPQGFATLLTAFVQDTGHI